MRSFSRAPRALLAILALTLSMLPLTLMTSQPAHAADGVCTTVIKPTWARYHFVIPAHGGAGFNCYMGYHQGSASAVKALQRAILWCYPDTSAADLVRESGGADGIYGWATFEAVRRIQQYRLHIEADGVFGRVTRREMEWPIYREGKYVGSCIDPDGV